MGNIVSTSAYRTMRFAVLLVFVALAVTAILAKDLRADESTAAPVTTPVTEGTGSTSEATEGTSAASTQAPATTEGNGASTISSTSVLLLSVAMCLFKF